MSLVSIALLAQHGFSTYGLDCFTSFAMTCGGEMDKARTYNQLRALTKNSSKTFYDYR